MRRCLAHVCTSIRDAEPLLRNRKDTMRPGTFMDRPFHFRIGTDDTQPDDGRADPRVARLLRLRRPVGPEAPDWGITAQSTVATPTGPRMADRLSAGDLVLTRDHGARPLAAVMLRRFGADILARRPDLLPVQIAPDALGIAGPDGTLAVTGRQRVVLPRGRSGQRLVPARDLRGLPGVTVPMRDSVVYVRLVLDAPAMILVAGIWLETGSSLAGCGFEARADDTSDG
jgi:hypothetical protein